MAHRSLAIIVATTADGVIGVDGTLPWRLRSDLRRFRRLTMGHHVIMGRRTYESLPSSLPGRHLVVLSRKPSFRVANGSVACNLQQALEMALDDPLPFVIGGAAVFEEALPLADRIYATVVHADVDGDTWFPRLTRDSWQLQEDKWHAADADNEYPYSFRTYDRR